MLLATPMPANASSIDEPGHGFEWIIGAEMTIKNTVPSTEDGAGDAHSAVALVEPGDEHRVAGPGGGTGEHLKVTRPMHGARRGQHPGRQCDTGQGHGATGDDAPAHAAALQQKGECHD